MSRLSSRAKQTLLIQDDDHVVGPDTVAIILSFSGNGDLPTDEETLERLVLRLSGGGPHAKKHQTDH